jgi:hypothetical protein
VAKSPKNKTYALVSTTRALLLVELEAKRVAPLEWGRGEYYGISWFPGSEDLVLTHSLLDNGHLVDVATYAQSEIGILSSGARQTQGFLSQPHQIFCGSDGRVICTNTGRNAVSALDLKRPDIIQEARISPARWDRLDSENFIGDHLNSVFEKNGFLYIIAHRMREGSALAVFSYPEMELLGVEPIKNRTGLHNIWVTDEGQQIACLSESGSLIELNSNTVLWDAGCPILSRGLAATSDFVLVGESEISARELRRASMSGLWLLDRETWQPMDYFVLGPYGGVHDIRLLNVRDEAHHGHVFAGTAALVAPDRGRALAEERLEASKRRRMVREAWKSFEAVFGVPELDNDGALKAHSGDLCLMVKPSADATEIGFGYEFNAFNASTIGAHVSAVVYRGAGLDTHMDAALIQPIRENEAGLTIWMHDGTRWALGSTASISGLPLRGQVRLTRGDRWMQLDIDGRSVPSEFLNGVQMREGQLGVRWSGVSIFPPGTN